MVFYPSLSLQAYWVEVFHHFTPKLSILSAHTSYNRLYGYKKLVIHLLFSAHNTAIKLYGNITTNNFPKSHQKQPYDNPITSLSSSNSTSVHSSLPRNLTSSLPPPQTLDSIPSQEHSTTLLPQAEFRLHYI